MGQQQLLLTIVVMVIVGFALVMAITRFDNAAETLNIEAIRLDIVNFAANAQTYRLKSPMYGGGGGSFEGITFRNVVFPAEGYSADNLMVANSNAVYTLSTSSPADTVITITAYPVTGISETSSGNSNASQIALQRANSNSGMYVTIDNSVLEAEITAGELTWIE